jgi:hypothetical protein
VQTDLFRQSLAIWLEERRPVGEQHHWYVIVNFGHDGGSLGIAFDVDESVGNLIAGQEVFRLVRAGRPRRAQNPNAVERGWDVGVPVIEQIIQDRVELVLRRIPRLHQVVIESDLVDRLDRRVGVGVGSQQHSFGVGKEEPGRSQKIGAFHLRHALVGQQKRY